MKVKLSDLSDDLVGRRAPRSGNSPVSGKRGQETVDDLRKRINEAIEYEDKLQRQIDAMRDEIATLNRQADESINKGNEAMARHFVARIQRTEQRLEMIEGDLNAHRLIAEELITQVNLLDSALADARYREEKPTDEVSSEPVGSVAIPVDVPDSELDADSKAAPDSDASARPESMGQAALDRFDSIFRSTQEKINQLGETIQKKRDESVTEIDQSGEPSTETVVDEAAIDDDLSARRNRLMKK